MKKNKAMRIASILMVAALVSTCAISGTFAKYVTGDSADDAARVAKFGVTVLASGALYSDTYKTVVVDDTDNTNDPGTIGDNKNINAADGTKLSVVSATFNGIADNWDGADPDFTQKINGITGRDNVVAPGTKNDEGLTFTFTGTPEVAVEVKIEKNEEYANEEIYLKKTADNQFYGVMVKVTVNNQNDFDRVLAQQDAIFYNNDGSFAEETAFVDAHKANYYVLHDTTETVTEDYYPVRYKLVKTVNGTDETLVNGERDTTVDGNKFRLKDVFDIIAPADAVKYSANTNLAEAIGTYKLTWEWDYEEKDAKADLATAKAEYDALSAAEKADNTNQKVIDYFAAKAVLDHYDHMDTILGDMIAQHKGATEYKVVTVVPDHTTATEVQYAEIETLNGETLKSKIIVAYVGTSTDPINAMITDPDGNFELTNGDVNLVAILSTSFGVDVTVTQID